MNRHVVFALLAVLGVLTGCVNADDSHPKDGNKEANSDASAYGTTHTVNGAIRVRAGEKKDDLSTVNGSVHIEDNAVVAGAETVNGAISLGAHATAESAHTVNGSITLGEGASVAHTISAVNGKLTLHAGADVAGAATNVNGTIALQAAHVGGGINTVSGDIDIGAHSRVEGGIVVQKEHDTFWFLHWGRSSTPRIVIGPEAVVQGNLRFERQVQLYVSEQASIGPVSGATAVKFSGATPPK
jgi:DUF4097 and DUF4098 domain-containing protein YvlB